MDQVIVTGGAGFIGSHVAETLIESGCFVTIIDNFRSGDEANLTRLKAGAFEVIQADVASIQEHEARLRGCRAVFHLAAEVGNINSIDNPLADAQTNILGTVAVCELARRTRMKVIYSSSSAIYGETVSLPVAEDHATVPLSPYGLSKLSGELYVRLYGRLFGIAHVCLRYFNVFGEGQVFNPYSNVIPIFVERLLRGGELIVYGDGRQTRDFVHVRDVAAANLLAFQSSVSAGSFNVGTGIRSSLIDLLEILRVLHGPATVRFDPPRAGEVRDSLADIRKIQAELGFQPKVSFRDGVRAYYEWRKASSHPPAG